MGAEGNLHNNTGNSNSSTRSSTTSRAEDWWQIDIPDPLHSQAAGAGAGAGSRRGDETSSPLPMFSWFGVCLCLMTRAPFVSELSAVLLQLYGSVLEDALLEREALASAAAADTAASTEDKYVQLQLKLCHILEPLCFDTPMPIPGYMDVAMHLLASPATTAINDEERNGVRTCSPGSLTTASASFHFSLQDLNGFPQCAYAIEHCIHLIGVRSLLDLLYHALSEHKILLHSCNPTTVLPLVCECLRTLLYPLKWCSVYIPTVPSLLLDLVEAPVPFILGIASSDLACVDSAVLSGVVRVDCDTGRVFTCTGSDGGSTDPGTDATPACCFAPALDRWCVVSLKSALVQQAGMLRGQRMLVPSVARKTQYFKPLCLIVYYVCCATYQTVCTMSPRDFPSSVWISCWKDMRPPLQHHSSAHFLAHRPSIAWCLNYIVLK